MAETIRCQYVRCGKESCQSCPHGPYWYAYWKEGGRTKSRYVGKVDPREGDNARAEQPRPAPEPPPPPPPPKPKPHPHDGIFKRETASKGLALEILGGASIDSREALDKLFKKFARANHPDRGGDGATMQRGEAAYSYLKSARSWRW